ncbi:T9SS type A sorting domain-containing protein [Winogradskyella sp.]|uniref:T9SS type A sorting domain-containing protein n=1 Tax=Winogradskyella sp. TaxID=1883156 RepID=UPI0025F30C77|nr:T9SS type A sorting domain-containing protein [Winogradskyella sp.]
MKKFLLLFSVLLIGFNSFSQTETIVIPWDFFSVPADDDNFDNGPQFDTDITIEVGDTVTWDFITGGHNVKSEAGSTEIFGTPGEQFDTFSFGYQYSYTFVEEGVNNFICAPHSTFMYGSVTVVREGTLSTEDFKNQNTEFIISPNPAKNKLNIKLPNANDDMKLEVFDLLGKRVYNGLVTQLESSLNVSNWKSGVYLVRVSNDKITQTKRFIKQ